MAVTILDILRNADYNLQNYKNPLGAMMAKEQLHNAMICLEKGYNLYESVEHLKDKYGSYEAIPEKET